MAGMRSVLTLDVSLGLFGFPVKVYKAINDPTEGVKFRQIAPCGHPINEVKRCFQCSTDVAHADLRKGYEHEPGKFLVFTNDEIKALKPKGEGVLTIDGYTAGDEIDPTYADGAVYFLSPANKDATTFTTFRDALANRWALGKVVMYGREHVVAIRPTERVLSMHFLRATNEIRNAFDVPGYSKIPESSKTGHLALMSQLMDANTKRVDEVVIESDSYVDAVKGAIAARMDGKELPVTEATSVPEAADLMAMLKASLAAKAA